MRSRGKRCLGRCDFRRGWRKRVAGGEWGDWVYICARCHKVRA